MTLPPAVVPVPPTHAADATRRGSRQRRAPSYLALSATGPAAATTPFFALTAGDYSDDGRRLRYGWLKNDPIMGAAWRAAAHVEFHKLVTVRKAMAFISRQDVPPDYKPTYFNMRCKVKNSAPRLRGTVGGDRMSCDVETAARTADLVTQKILINHALSAGWELSDADAVDFYLYTKLATPEFMFIMV